MKWAPNEPPPIHEAHKLQQSRAAWDLGSSKTSTVFIVAACTARQSPSLSIYALAAQLSAPSMCSSSMSHLCSICWEVCGSHIDNLEWAQVSFMNHSGIWWIACVHLQFSMAWESCSGILQAVKASCIVGQTPCLQVIYLWCEQAVSTQHIPFDGCLLEINIPPLFRHRYVN